MKVRGTDPLRVAQASRRAAWMLYFKRESHAPFYATALLLVLNQRSQPGRWKIANTINIAIALLATAVMTVRSEGCPKALAASGPSSNWSESSQAAAC